MQSCPIDQPPHLQHSCALPESPSAPVMGTPIDLETIHTQHPRPVLFEVQLRLPQLNAAQLPDLATAAYQIQVSESPTFARAVAIERGAIVQAGADGAGAAAALHVFTFVMISGFPWNRYLRAVVTTTNAGDCSAANMSLLVIAKRPISNDTANEREKSTMQWNQLNEYAVDPTHPEPLQNAIQRARAHYDRVVVLRLEAERTAEDTARLLEVNDMTDRRLMFRARIAALEAEISLRDEAHPIEETMRRLAYKRMHDAEDRLAEAKKDVIRKLNLPADTNIPHIQMMNLSPEYREAFPIAETRICNDGLDINYQNLARQEIARLHQAMFNEEKRLKALQAERDNLARFVPDRARSEMENRVAELLGVNESSNSSDNSPETADESPDQAEPVQMPRRRGRPRKIAPQPQGLAETV